MKILVWMFMGFDKHTTSEHLFTAIIEQICKKNNSVHIIQKYTGGDLPSIPSSLSQYDIVTNTINEKKIEKNNLVKRYIEELSYINESKQYFWEDYDSVFIQSNNVAGFAVKAIRNKCGNVNITFNVQDIFPYNALFSGKLKKKSIEFKILSMVQRYAYKKSNHIITISEDMKELLIQDGVSNKKISVIYNWSYQNHVYDSEKMDFACLTGMFSRQYFNVVYAGNIGVMQNVDVIIEAAKLLKNRKDIWFHVIGDGVYTKKLQQRTIEYGISNITFLPMQSPDLAPYIYSTADINIIPLVKNIYKTALPSKTATCLACQKPIIFAIGTESLFGKKIKEETGCSVVESDDAEALVSEILKIKDEKLKYNYKDFFEKYFSRKNAMKYVDIITNAK